MSQASRYWQAQDSKNRGRSEVMHAQDALTRFRDNGNPSGFPELRRYLWMRNIGLGYRDLSLDHYGPWNYPRLTEEEYTSFKVAFLATENGIQDDWAIKHKDDSFW